MVDLLKQADELEKRAAEIVGDLMDEAVIRELEIFEDDIIGLIAGQSKLIKELSTKVREQEKALEDIEAYSAGSGHTYLQAMNDIVKVALAKPIQAKETDT